MSHLSPQITHRFEEVTSGIAEAAEQWDQYLRLANRDHITSAAERLHGLDRAIRNLRKDLEVETGYAVEGDIP